MTNRIIFTKEEIVGWVTEMPEGAYTFPELTSYLRRTSLPLEPTSRGSLVIDSDGDLWVLTKKSERYPWSEAAGNGSSSWEGLNERYGPVKVLYKRPAID